VHHAGDQQALEGFILANGVRLGAELTLPADAQGVVVFAHGTGSGRFSRRNRAVAGLLARSGLATLVLDLLTPDEEAIDRRTSRLRFDVALLARRVIATIDWLEAESPVKGLPLGCFGASTGAAAALVAAAERPESVHAVVSRGGRPDLAAEALQHVTAPVLLIVGGNDREGLRLNKWALSATAAEARLEIVPGAANRFEEPGALERVALLGRAWCLRYLARGPRTALRDARVHGR
jgi:dienelactone hydrolase